MSYDEVIKQLNSQTTGLSSEDVSKQRETHGSNILEESKSVSTAIIFLSQFKDFLVVILMVAAAVSAMMGKLESTLVIIAVLIINALLGTIQHVKAEQSLKSLKALSAPSSKVLREGCLIEIPSSEVVVGDILIVEAGDFIAADARIIESNSLQVNESALTGESVSVEKVIEPISKDDVAIGDRVNMIFSSSHVTYGRGKAVVTGVGVSTEIGHIASLLKSAQEKATPLQENLDNFGKKLAILIIIISSIVFGLNLYRGAPIMDSLMFAISLAVAAIPEALSSIVTIVLAFGTRKLAEENAIIRKLHSVESLGSISIICSDKTGTLTQNKMTVQKIFTDNKLIDVDAIDKENSLHYKLVMAGLLCSDAITTKEKEIGDPTEIALVDLGERLHLDELIVREVTPRISELPFDSDRKLMTTLQHIDGKSVVFTKGAMDVLLDRSTHIETAQGVRLITQEDKDIYNQINFELANQGLRVLAFAWKEVEENTLTFAHEGEMILFGLVAMMDPPRAESKGAVESCIAAGIKPIMITGDHKVTASAIARQIGILQEGDQALEGADIEHLTEEELIALVPKVSVYARVSPEHKIRIVSAWQALGHVVAMTGDGVNDAPALKRADIGIAMGITGTEVAKDAANMVLTDDNFATIIKAINNGRSIYGNIKNAVRFLLSGNTAGILAVVYTSIMGLMAPFSPVHLLFINLLTDSLPAIAIGLEPANSGLMKEKPRNAKTPILDRAFGLQVLFEGTIIAVVTMIAYYLGYQNGSHRESMTMAFATLSLSRLVHGLNCRNDAPLSLKTLWINPFSYLALILGALLLSAVLFLEPLHKIFEISILTNQQYMSIVLLSIIPLIVVQIVKRIKYRK
ncbi:cation-translocating P-type ATPase [Lacrimispora amygdalina]|uniref:Cation-translocating P-type ATPase n=3 Tax=Lachnospiraceae TaxID=186803 RepID=A0ABX1VXN6_9FIRM|nr:cation-translocating P-type ATPase [Lacrimispora defluvii]RFZ75643.1 cation-translocating P-type ATPase [Clostridium indicum]